MHRTRRFVPLWIALLALAGLGLIAPGSMAETGQDPAAPFRFTDVKEDTRQFMEYYRSITLTPAQERIHKAAVAELPAPCCSNRSAYTCCCDCNLAEAWWGLSKHLIADRGYGADEVRATVQRWFDFTNPNGFTGDACYTRGCGRAFRDNGCGGMDDKHVVF